MLQSFRSRVYKTVFLNCFSVVPGIADFNLLLAMDPAGQTTAKTSRRTDALGELTFHFLSSGELVVVVLCSYEEPFRGLP